MFEKSAEKAKAVKLRKQGKTYNEIITEVGVAKSTLSLWLREVGLSRTQQQKLTKRKVAAQKLGAEKRRSQRIAETEIINDECRYDIQNLTDRELFLMGVVLYWAEGAKPKDNNPSAMIDFANSDPAMLKLFVKWLIKFGNVKKSDINLRLHLHYLYKRREVELKKYWGNMLNIPEEQFAKTNFKKHNPKTKRINVGEDYKGLVAIRVRKSTILNRRIMGWIHAIIATQK